MLSTEIETFRKLCKDVTPELLSTLGYIATVALPKVLDEVEKLQKELNVAESSIKELLEVHSCAEHVPSHCQMVERAIAFLDRG